MRGRPIKRTLRRRVIGEIIPESCIHLCEEPNRVLILINGHNQSKVTEFFLTDWIQENIYSLDRLNMATCELAAPRSL